MALNNAVGDSLEQLNANVEDATEGNQKDVQRIRLIRQLVSANGGTVGIVLSRN